MSVPSKFFLFKRSNDIYYIVFEEQSRKRWKSTRCKLKSDALRALTQFQLLFKEKPRTVSLNQFTKEYLDYCRVNHAQGTVDIARIALGHLESVAGDCPISSVSPHHLDKYRSKRLGKVSPVSVNVELRALRSIMNVALRWKYIEHNPFSGMKLVPVPERTPSYLSKVEFEALVSAIREQWLRDVVLFAVLTGLRRGETINLRWKDVDLTRRLAHIESHGSFKTKRGQLRHIPLNLGALHVLESRAKTNGASEYVFTQRGRQITEDWLTHRFKHYVKKAKLENQRVHFHSLRHTFASWLVQEGVSLYEVQKLLGHSSMAVTQVYSHLQPEQLHEVVDRLEIQMS